MKRQDLNEASDSSNAALDRAVDELGWQVINPKLTALKQIDINGIELTYIEQGKGQLVVFVHGALGDCRTCSHQVALLAQKYHVVSYSRRYHEPNSLPNREIDYTHRRHVDDLISLIEALGPGPAHLVGHSYGAAVAALVAMERPELVNSLILSEPSLFSMISDPPGIKFHCDFTVSP